MASFARDLVPALWLLASVLQPFRAWSQITPSARIVTFIATEYSFRGPSQISAGLVTIRLVNRGKEVHWMETFRLGADKTLADFLAATTASQSEFQPPHSWTTATGGPGWIGPGEVSNQTAYLQPGHYALICRFPTAAGVQHVKKGMVHELAVNATPAPAAAEPQADITLTITDSAFVLPDSISPGMHTLLVHNGGSVRHELYVFRLAPRKSIEDYWAWERTRQRGPRPGRPFGGVTPFEAGTRVWFTAVFHPGKYVFGDESGEGEEIFRQITVR